MESLPLVNTACRILKIFSIKCILSSLIIIFCGQSDCWKGTFPYSSHLNIDKTPFNVPYNKNVKPCNIFVRDFKTHAFEGLSDKVLDFKNVIKDKLGLSNEMSKVDKGEVTPYNPSEYDLSASGNATNVNVTEETTYPFQAEVSRVMDIIVNSLYTDRDIFLRELVSNAADALDKRRIKADPEEKISKEAFGGIRIRPDKSTNTLIIEDDGIGMTMDELKNNLGTIAESGTAKFLKQLESGKDESNLIGQFGVGFYSAFLVADKVEVFSRSYGNEGGAIYRWKSDTKGTFSIGQVDDEAVNKDFMPCGTRIVLHLKPECDDYLEDYKLKELLRKYSEFIRFPIQVWVEKVEYERVPDESTAVEGKPGRYKTVTKNDMNGKSLIHKCPSGEEINPIYDQKIMSHSINPPSRFVDMNEHSEHST